MGTQAARLMSGQFLEILRKSDPSIPDRALALVKQVLDAEFAMAFSEPGGLTEQLVVIYAKHFSREEVRALLSLYSVGPGQEGHCLNAGCVSGERGSRPAMGSKTDAEDYKDHRDPTA